MPEETTEFTYFRTDINQHSKGDLTPTQITALREKGYFTIDEASYDESLAIPFEEAIAVIAG